MWTTRDGSEQFVLSEDDVLARWRENPVGNPLFAQMIANLVADQRLYGDWSVEDVVEMLF